MKIKNSKIIVSIFLLIVLLSQSIAPMVIALEDGNRSKIDEEQKQEDEEQKQEDEEQKQEDEEQKQEDEEQIIQEVQEELNVEVDRRGDLRGISEESEIKVEDLGNIIDDVKLEIKKKDQAQYEEVESVDIEIEEGDALRFALDWRLDDNVNLKSGDYTIIQLPKNLTISERSGEIQGLSPEQTIGNYEINDNNELKLIFNDVLVEYTDRTGYVKLNYDVRHILENNLEEEIHFEFRVKKHWKISAKNNYDETKFINKKSTTENGSDTDVIEWQIDINEESAPLKDVKITEIPGEDLEIIEFEIYEVTKEGTEDDEPIFKFSKDSQESDKPEITVSEDGKEIEFGDIDERYRIKLKTKITREDTEGKQETYKNSVKMEYRLGENGEKKGILRESEVNIFNRNFVKKTGKHKNGEGNRIEWEVVINPNKQDISNLSIEDTLIGDHKLVGEIDILIGGIKDNNIKPVIINEGKGFSISYKFVESINETITLKYETEVEFGLLDKFNQEKSFKNEIKVTHNDKQYCGEDTVMINRENWIKKVGEGPSGIEGKEYGKKITWTITVNPGEEKLGEGFKFEDTLGKGLEYIPGSLEVYKEGDTENSSDVKYEVTGFLSENYVEEGSNQKTTITFPEGLNDTVIVKYDTKITNFKLDEYKNKIVGNGIEEGEQEIVIATNLKSTLAKKFVRIDYDKQEVDWEIKIKSNSGKFKDISITDNLSENHKIIKDSIVLSLDKKELSKDTDYTVTINEENSGFKINFKDKNLVKKSVYDDTLIITYKTTFKDTKELINGEKAILSNDEKAILSNDVTATVDTENRENEKLKGNDEIIIKDWIRKNIKKNVLSNLNEIKDNRKIKWQIVVNPLNIKLDEFIIKDTLSERQSLDEKSIKFYKYDIENNLDGLFMNNGDNDLGLGKDDYILEYTADGFTITVKEDRIISDEDDRRFIIEYKTLISGISKKNYRNTVEFNKFEDYAEIEYPDYNVFLRKEISDGSDTIVFPGDIIDWKIFINESNSKDINNFVFEDKISKGHKLIPESLEILKDGKKIDESELKEFTIENEDNIDGEYSSIINIKKKLLSGKYEIRYSTMVEEFEGDEKELEISNKAKVSGTDIEEGTINTGEIKDIKVFADVEAGGQGTLFRGSITINKVDTENKPIAGDSAIFIVSRLLPNGEYIDLKEIETNGFGTASVENLGRGKYKLKEIKAPEGYDLLEEEIEFEITPSETDNEKHIGKDIKIEVLNEKSDRTIEIQKVDKESKKPLSGAEFELLDSSGELIESGETNENGILEFTGLGKGSYTLIETKAPEGYELNRGKRNIELYIENGETKEITVENEKIRVVVPGEPDRPVVPIVPVDPTNPTDPKDPGKPEEDKEVDEEIKEEKDEEVTEEQVTEEDTELTETESENETVVENEDRENTLESPSRDKEKNKDKAKETLLKTGSKLNKGLFISVGLIIALLGVYLVKKED